MTLYVGLAQQQFQLLGKYGQEARDLAVTAISVFQGASLLANTFRDPALMASQARQLEHWTETVA
jgi:TetR/AcrR family transcriptional repressor of nem operon